jgi:hypothetical protein
MKNNANNLFNDTTNSYDTSKRKNNIIQKLNKGEEETNLEPNKIINNINELSYNSVNKKSYLNQNDHLININTNHDKLITNNYNSANDEIK